MKLLNPRLKDKDKTKLIEILLIVGGILSVFKLNIQMLLFFILFLLFSLIYYISLNSKLWREGLPYKIPSPYKLSSIIVSLTFSAVASSILAEAMANSGIWMARITSSAYYVTFSLVLYLALYE